MRLRSSTSEALRVATFALVAGLVVYAPRLVFGLFVLAAVSALFLLVRRESLVILVPWLVVPVSALGPSQSRLIPVALVLSLALWLFAWLAEAGSHDRSDTWLVSLVVVIGLPITVVSALRGEGIQTALLVLIPLVQAAWAGRHSQRTRLAVLATAGILGWLAVLERATGFSPFQVIAGTDIRNVGAEAVVGLMRVRSAFGHPLVAGWFFSVGFAIGVGMRLEARVKAVLMAGAALGAMATLSRSPTAFLLAAVVVSLLASGRGSVLQRRSLIAAAAVAAVLFVLGGIGTDLGERTQTSAGAIGVQQRRSGWSWAEQNLLSADRLLVGAGAHALNNAFRTGQIAGSSASDIHTFDNQWITLGYDAGLIEAMASLAVLVGFVVHRGRSFGVVAALPIAGILVATFSFEVFYWPSMVALLGALAADEVYTSSDAGVPEAVSIQ